MRFAQVQLLVRDFDACFRFYRDVMRFPVTFGAEGEEYADFDAGEVALALFPHASSAQSIGAGNVTDIAGGQDRVAVCLTVMRDLQAHGAELVAGPTDQPMWGLRAAHVRGPDGTLIEISDTSPMQEV